MKSTFRLLSIRSLSLCLLCLMALAVSTPNAPAQAVAKQGMILFPMPQKMTHGEGALALQPGKFIVLQSDEPSKLLFTGEAIQAALVTAGAHWELTAAAGKDPKWIGAVVTLKPNSTHGPESYTLAITKERIEIQAGGPAGAYHAAMTLKQLARQSAGTGKLPCLAIEDWADIPNRGAMLDISRNKVPTMETLYKLADMMAEFKMNQLQLYTEHTFAYHNHKDVWEKASPMTAEQILKLDAYCRDRFIELVPNQNSFGHMDRWLGIERYRPLAEDPKSPSALCPTDPKAIELLDELYGELLPNFSSRQINVGCDEVTIGQGRSKPFVKSDADIPRLYLNFLLKIHDLVQKNGRKMQFWADIILQHPEYIPELPKDVTALDWGYEAEHPYAEQCEKFAKAGIPFYVCPGTSAWNAIIGRTDNMKANMLNAASNAKKFKGSGLLITSWGDAGHWDHISIAFAGYTYGAAVSWALDANKDIDLAQAMDVHVFQDQAGVMGKLVLDLGNTYKETGLILPNQTTLWYIMHNYMTPRGEDPVFKQVNQASIEKALTYLDKTMINLPKARMTNPDAKLITAEIRNNAAIIRHACLLDIARCKAGGKVDPARLPAETRRELAADLRKIITDFRTLWLVRNREGGLADSITRMQHLLEQYEAK